MTLYFEDWRLRSDGFLRHLTPELIDDQALLANLTEIIVTVEDDIEIPINPHRLSHLCMLAVLDGVTGAKDHPTAALISRLLEDKERLKQEFVFFIAALCDEDYEEAAYLLVTSGGSICFECESLNMCPLTTAIEDILYEFAPILPPIVIDPPFFSN